MNPWFERYLSGDCITVWQELHAIEDVGSLDIDALEDARLVSRETIRRSHRNLVEIHDRLDRAGWSFEEPRWSRPVNTDGLTVAEMLRGKFGRLPLVLDAWLEDIGLISLRGYPQATSVEAWQRIMLDPFEVLIGVASLSDDLAVWRDEDQGEPFRCSIAGDTYHKNNTSGGPATVIILPSLTVDMRVMESPAQSLNVDTGTWFIDYLRTYFESAGFRQTPLSMPDALAAIPISSSGLLPI